MSTIMYSKMGETKGSALDEIHNKQRALEFSVVFGAINFGCVTLQSILDVKSPVKKSLLIDKIAVPSSQSPTSTAKAGDPYSSSRSPP